MGITLTKEIRCERDLEDVICDNLPVFFWEHTELIGRQVGVQDGIVDILAWSGHNMCWNDIPLVVELKMTPLKEKDLGQLLRYVGNIKALLACMDMACWDEGPIANIVNRRLHDADSPGHPSVKGFLIGPSADERVLSAAYGANVSVGQWTIKDGKLSIDTIRGLHPYNHMKPSCYEELETRIYQACIEDLFCNRASRPIDHTWLFDKRKVS